MKQLLCATALATALATTSAFAADNTGTAGGAQIPVPVSRAQRTPVPDPRLSSLAMMRAAAPQPAPAARALTKPVRAPERRQARIRAAWPELRAIKTAPPKGRRQITVLLHLVDGSLTRKAPEPPGPFSTVGIGVSLASAAHLVVASLLARGGGPKASRSSCS